MLGITEYLQPSTLEETLQILNDKTPDIKVLSGGTHLALQKNIAARILLDIKNSGLSYIKEDKEKITIGSTTTMAEIADSYILQNFACGILTKAALKIGYQTTRNLVTIGGNIYSNFPWSNLPSALMVLDASIEFKSFNSLRTINFNDLPLAQPSKVIPNNAIITAIQIPKTSKDLLTSYQTFSQTENDKDFAIIAVSSKIHQGICKSIIIALGAAIYPGKIIFEKHNLNFSIENIDINFINNEALDNINMLKDFRTTDEHKIEVVKSLIKTAFEDIKSKV